jgi:ribose 5-phosphate isomerase B
MCLGGRVIGQALAWDLVKIFLSASFKGTGRFKRRLAKVAALERKKSFNMRKYFSFIQENSLKDK